MVHPADHDAGAGEFDREHQSLRSAVDRDR